MNRKEIIFGELSSALEIAKSIDLKGLVCPLPLLKMKLALQGLKEGEVLEVFTTDEVSVRDFKSYCDLSANKLIAITKTDTCFEFLIRKG
jgi:tRNA 2-thiouridine synthesizing protein A